MKTNWKFKVGVLLVFFLSVMVGVSFAAEAVVEQDTVTSVTEEVDIVKTADNFISVLGFNTPQLAAIRLKITAQ